MNIYEILKTLVTGQLDDRPDQEFERLNRPLSRLAGRIDLKPKLLPREGGPAETPPGADALPMSAVLRIDPEQPFVSGDVFQARDAFKGPYKLGGRTDWFYSFYGPLRYVIRTETTKVFAGVCVIVRNQGAKSDPFVQRGAVAITTDLSESHIIDVQFLYYFDSGVVHAWRGHQSAPTDPAFRRVRLIFWADETVKENEKYSKIVDMLTDEDDIFSVRGALRSVGIDALVEHEHDFDTICRMAPVADDDPCSDPFLERDADADADWTHIIRFEDFNAAHDGADAHDGHDHPSGGTDNTIYGITHGLGDAQHRFRSRFQARINLASIAADAKERGLEFEGPDAELKQMAWQVRHTTVHEFGHLLNMPHPWSRETAYDLLDTSMPDAMSWMNYPGLFPLGTITKAYLSSFGRPQRDALTARLSKRFHQRHRENIRRNAGYTQMEKHFIRHAPLNQIAQGGDTFLDHRLPAPKIKPPTNRSDVRLEIVVPMGGALHPAREVNLFFFHQLKGNTEQLPVLPAFVRVHGGHGPGDHDHDKIASLVAGNLQVLLRKRNTLKPEHWFNDEPTKILILDPIKDLEDRKAILSKASALDMGIADEIGDPESTRSDLITLPWLELSRLKDMFGNGSLHEFAMQAVLFLDGSEIRSEVLRLTYSDVPDNIATRRTVLHPFASALSAKGDRKHFEVSPLIAAHTTVRTLLGEAGPISVPTLTNLGREIFANANQIHLFNMSDATMAKLIE